MMFLLFFLTKLNIVHLATQSYENQLGKTKLNDKKRQKNRIINTRIEEHIS